ncbi:MAG: DUF3604 domain-containing protein [Spirochaetaceae bacterium]
MSDNEHAYFGDLHNHCNMSYAHGDLEDAIRNAQQRLDFVSVTGHAHWTDMPEPTERTGHIVEFHEVGFAKLKRNWAGALEKLAAAERPGEFVTFPGFEVHSSADGDRAVIYRDAEGELLYPDSVAELDRRLAELNAAGRPAFGLPHHIGYHQGARGINWETFDEDASPVVEIFSMHGGAETTEGPLPFLHSMGPADWRSTMQYGLAKGRVFGVVANTDHHSAHPGSYGHGMAGVWARELSREGIWTALMNRRTFALTGDRMRLDYRLGGTPMGGIRAPGRAEGLELHLEAGAAVDYVDVIHNNRLARRITPLDVRPVAAGPGAGTAGAAGDGAVRTKVYLEVGWGPRGRRAPWEVDFGVTAGEIIEVEPRFRGPDVLTPEQEAEGASGAFYSHCRRRDERSVHFETLTFGNPTSSTPGTQGVCLDVRIPPDAKIWARVNGVYTETTPERLLAGGKSGHVLHEIDSAAWLFHRLPAEWELNWDLDLADFTPTLRAGDSVYVRVRQQNNQWAWGSPVFVR